MTGNGIESDFVLPDSLSYRIIAHCQLSISILAQTVVFFAQLACRRIHLRLLLPEPEALPLDSAKGSSTLWTPVRAIQLSAFSYYARVLIGGTQGALPLDSAKGSSTLWTPVRAIQLVTLSYYARVLIGGTQGRCPWTPVRAIQLVTLSCYVRVLIR